MVALTTPARRAISDMLLSGSLASASRAASRMAATLRSASARRRLGAGASAGVVVGFVISVARHRAGVQPHLRHEVACPRQDGDSDQAGDSREEPGCDERVGDSGCGLWAGDGAASGGDGREDRDPYGPADFVPGRVEARDHPGLPFAGAGEDGDRDRDDGDAEPESADEHSWQDVTDVAAVLADVGEQGHAGGGDEEGAGEWAADAVLADDVSGRVRADSCRERERDKGEARRGRPPPEHVLQVERAEQQEAENG